MDVAPEDGWLLIKRGFYWRPNAVGYTGFKSEAGIYSDEQASAHADHGDGTTKVRFRDADEFSPMCPDDAKVRVLTARLETLQRERDEAVSSAAAARANFLTMQNAANELRKERDEAINWTETVDRHGTDGFDDLAEAWLALPRTTNAAISIFSRWASDDLMTRFKKNQLSMFHLAFVEGCLAGVRAEIARAALTKGE